MSVRRALVDGAVLSLQDGCVFYPSCQSCFSRLEAEQLDATRYRCSRCGYRCVRDQVAYRYRLSLMVTRDRCIFGVTVFGNSLNAFFGIHASGLQKIVENLEGPAELSTKNRLLVKAVEDCFIGRHFIFGIKLTGTERGPWFGDSGSNGSNSKKVAQFVASQMILPKAAGLTGCSVLSYYQVLLQKASEYEGGSAPLLLLVPGPSPSSSFSDDTLRTSGLLRSQHSDNTLALTAPWQQSLGVVTSSAEQDEEGCESQDSGDNSRQTDDRTAPHPAQGDYLERRTSLLPLEHSLYNRPTGHQSSSHLSVNACFSVCQPACRRSSLSPKEKSSRPSLSSSLLWEDLPFSESLSEFLHEPNKDVENVGEKGLNLNEQCEKQTARTSLKVTKPSSGPASACQRNTQILFDINNAAGPDRGDGRDSSDRGRDRPESGRLHVHECHQEGDEAVLAFEKENESSYNCSADLFSNSLINRETLHTLAESVVFNSSTRSPFSTTEQQHLRNVAQLTPHKWELQIRKCNNRDSLILQDTQECDFVPPSQSTPLVKLVTQSPASLHKNRTYKSSKERRIITPGRKFSIRPQKMALNSESTRRARHKLDSRNVSNCDSEVDEGLVAPTPVGKRQQSVWSKCRRERGNWSRGLGLTRKRSQRDPNRLSSDRTPTSSGRRRAQTVTSESWKFNEGNPNQSDDYLSDEGNQTCDWSKDLFSDSV